MKKLLQEVVRRFKEIIRRIKPVGVCECGVPKDKCLDKTNHFQIGGGRRGNDWAAQRPACKDLHCPHGVVYPEYTGRDTIAWYEKQIGIERLTSTDPVQSRDHSPRNGHQKP